MIRPDVFRVRPPWHVPLRAFLLLAWVVRHGEAHDSPMESHGESKIHGETHGKPMGKTSQKTHLNRANTNAFETLSSKFIKKNIPKKPT